MRLIGLTRGMSAMVDDCDYDSLNEFRWYTNKNYRTYYAATKRPEQTVQMHRVILSAPMGVLVDHIDGNGLNNQRANLRFASPSENTAHRLHRPAVTSSRYRGVTYNRRTSSWQAGIKVAGKSRHLGLFECEDVAAHAYDAAARRTWGQFAVCNFPMEGS